MFSDWMHYVALRIYKWMSSFFMFHLMLLKCLILKAVIWLFQIIVSIKFKKKRLLFVHKS